MDLNELKSIIRGLIISLPTGMTLRTLDKDFYEMIGYGIPYQQMNFPTLETFLQSIPDTVKLNGYGPNASVLPVVTDKISHIDQMVTSQRINQPKNRYKYGSNFNGRRQQGVRNDQQYYTTFENTLNASNHRTNHQNVQANCSTPIQLRIPPAGYELQNTDQFYKPSIVQDVQRNVYNPGVNNHQEPSQSVGHVALSKNIPSETKTVDPSCNSGRIPTLVLSNLRIMICEHDEGIWCSRLPDMYRKRFGKKLDFEAYGYPRVISMCADTDIFHLVWPNKGDHLLYDKLKPLPVDDKSVSLPVNEEPFVAAEEPSYDDAHDVIMERYINYPDDVVHLGEQIPSQWLLKDMDKNSLIQIKVGEVYDPSKFWIYLQHPECSEALDKMMDEMQLYYREYGKDLLIPTTLVKELMFVSTMFLDEYHRAIVVKIINGEDKMKVYFFDYGTVASVSKSSLYYLSKRFSTLPRQAIRARLISLSPLFLNQSWSREASSRFLNLVFAKVLYAYLHHIDEKLQELFVSLYDTSAGDEVIINQALIDEGFAVNNGEKRLEPECESIVIPNIENIHLFPTFLEIEMALVPSAVEIMCLLDIGCSLDHIYPQYYTNANPMPASKQNKALSSNSIVTDTENQLLELCEVQDIPQDDSISEHNHLSFNTQYSTEFSSAQNQNSNSKNNPYLSNSNELFTNRIPPLAQPSCTPRVPPGFKPINETISDETLKANCISLLQLLANNYTSAAQQNTLKIPQNYNPPATINHREGNDTYLNASNVKCINTDTLCLLNSLSLKQRNENSSVAAECAVRTRNEFNLINKERVVANANINRWTREQNENKSYPQNVQKICDINETKQNVLTVCFDENPIHVVRYENELYILLVEVLKYFTKYGSYPRNIALRLITMKGCVLPVFHINLKKNVSLKNVLTELNIPNLEDDLSCNLLNVISINSIPEFVQTLHDVKLHLQINWNNFLRDLITMNNLR